MLSSHQWLARETDAALVDQFIDHPHQGTYRAVRDVLLGDPTYRMLSLELAEVDRMARDSEWTTALDMMEALLPGCLLSPRLHFFSANFASQLGDHELAEVERFLFRTCLDGILDTGTGHRHAPFLVSHATDVADVLNTLEIDRLHQQLVSVGDQRFDVVRAADGSQYWFDVSDLVVRDPTFSWQAETLLN